MPQLQPQVTQWLQRVVTAEHIDRQRVIKDSIELLVQYPSLSPRTKVFHHEDGTTDLLLCIQGTLPVSFRNTVYQIPIEIWIPKKYPQLRPIAYVAPTASMGIRPGNHVDPNGVIYHPLLAYWDSRKDLTALTEILKDIFGKEPPVFARHQGIDRAAAPSLAKSSSPVPPLLHLNLSHADRSRTQSPNINPSSPISRPPPLPPSPHRTSATFSPPPPPLPPPSPHRSLSVASPCPAQPPGPPSLPPHPHPQTPLPHQAQHPKNHSPPSSLPPTPSSSTPAAPAPPAPPPPPLPSTHPLAYSHPHPSSQHTSGYSQVEQSAPLSSSAFDIFDLEDALPTQSPPPKPVNPHRSAQMDTVARALDDRLQGSAEKTGAILNSTRSTRERLLHLEASLDRERGELRRLSQTCEQDSHILRDKIAQAERAIHEAKDREELNIDDILVGSRTVIYELMSEDMAIDDTIYMLGNALDQEVVGLDSFLKNIRALAREQFMKKALALKIKQGIQLPD